MSVVLQVFILVTAIYAENAFWANGFYFAVPKVATGKNATPPLPPPRTPVQFLLVYYIHGPAAQEGLDTRPTNLITLATGGVSS